MWYEASFVILKKNTVFNVIPLDRGILLMKAFIES